MTKGITTLAALLVALAAAGCAADANDTSAGRAANPNVANPNAIGPGAAAPPAPRDMPGGGRGSATFKGK